MCPGQHESAGKQKTGKRRAGNKALRRALAEAAKAAARTKKHEKTYLAGRYRALVVRRGQQKATIAVGHSILRFVYHILATHEPYNERTLMAQDERRQARAKHRALAQLSALGYDVTLAP